MKNSGFTLLELSIVLVIVGLIVGGVTVGSELITQAKLANVIAEKDRVIVGTKTFKLKYASLPGDIKNATAYWGAAHSNAATCKTTQGTGTATCNGDGDGYVASDSTPGQINNVTFYENFRFWQQLAIAGLIEGSFTGVQGPVAWYQHVPGVNVPETAFSNMLFSAYSNGILTTSDSNFFEGNYYNSLVLTLSTTENMSWIDRKIDDGKPGLGRVVTGPSCSTTTSPATAEYNYATTAQACALFVMQAY